jgi:hypothetical protein
MNNLDNLSPSDLAALRAKLFPEGDPSGRSPLRPRQLNDLRLLPTATDPRPTFFWSAEGQRDAVIEQHEFPKLLWHGTTNQEITVHSKAEETAKLDSGYVRLPIDSIVIDQVQSLAEQLAGLPEAEQQMILAAQQDSRRASLTAKLSQLSEADLERLIAAATGEPAKKRGRPAKVA